MIILDSTFKDTKSGGDAMDIEENIKLFQQYQKSNKLDKAAEVVDESHSFHQ